MARALSQDLRSRVIVAVKGGLSCRAAAKRFGVGIATAIRWLKAWRTEGRTTALPMGGDLRSHRIEAFARVILGAIEARSSEGARALAHEHVLHSCRLLEVILDHVAPAA